MALLFRALPARPPLGFDEQLMKASECPALRGMGHDNEIARKTCAAVHYSLEAFGSNL